MKKLQKGFTLIELLVVIAIIAILAAVVLVNVNAARSRARDAAIKQGMAQYRSQQELAYDSSNSYVAFTTTTNTEIQNIVESIRENTINPTNNNSIRGTSNATAYALKVQLVSDTTKAWCVDSTGVAREIAWTTSNVSVCPAS